MPCGIFIVAGAFLPICDVDHPMSLRFFAGPLLLSARVDRCNTVYVGSVNNVVRRERHEHESSELKTLAHALSSLVAVTELTTIDRVNRWSGPAGSDQGKGLPKERKTNLARAGPWKLAWKLAKKACARDLVTLEIAPPPSRI